MCKPCERTTGKTSRTSGARFRREWGRYALLFYLGLVLLPVRSSLGQNEIRWRSGTVRTIVKTKESLQSSLTRLIERPEAKRVVLQMKRPLTRADRDRFAANGVQLLNYVGGQAYFAQLPLEVDRVSELMEFDLIRDVMPVDTSWKMHPMLVRGDLPEWTITDREYLRALEDADGDRQKVSHLIPQDPTVGVYVLFHSDVLMFPFGHIHTAMHGGRVISELKSINGLVIEIPYSRIHALAREDDVMYLEPALPKMVGLNNSSRALVGADIVQAAPYNLDGSGVTVLVYDSGTVLTSHPDFGTRVSVRDSSGLQDHSTHVAGTLGGDGSASSGLYRGMAPGVTIESYGFEPEFGFVEGFLFSDPGDLESDYNEAINVHGADIANNSIGSNTSINGFSCELIGDYGVTSALIDAIVRGSLGAPMRIVWSNGNERQTTTCGDSFKTTAPPACAKNHITVGAVNSNDDTMTSFSSWGPCDDGRIKPDLVAPGCQNDDDQEVTSTSDIGAYTGRCGTSMAAPVVTGIGALLLQDYRAQFPSNPDFLNSTLKVFLTHTAVDLGQPGPDYKYGYGSVRAQPAVDLLRSGSFLESELNQGQIIPSFIEVPEGTLELKVTIAWDDPPGMPGVVPSLVNDLDLRVVDTSSGIHYPWTLDSENPGLAAVRTSPDRINNIEQVVIDNPPAGVYRIEIHGFSIPIGPQKFSLAATPNLLPCSSLGSLTFDRDVYQCESTANLEVVDCDLNTNDTLVEMISITVTSDSEPGGETVLLTESEPDSATFRGMLTLSSTDSAGVLLLSHNDTLTATYVDADTGAGGMNIPITDTAGADCVVPMTTSVVISNVTSIGATVDVQVNEPANVSLVLGTNCGVLTTIILGDQPATSHVFNLTGLADDTTFFFRVDMEDVALNQSSDDNGGLCYSFKTSIVLDSFTELFDAGDIDLDGLSTVFTPDGSQEFYRNCVIPVSGLQLDTSSAITIDIPDDAFMEVILSGGETIPFYGTNYASFYVGSNGYVTFTAGDFTRSESFANHFNLPRISALFDDLNPAAGGRMSWEQLADRAVVTFENVPRFSSSDSNSFQIEMFFMGEIRIVWSGIDVTNALAGLSRGTGIPTDFFESDLSNFSPCNPRSPDAPGGVQQVISGRSIGFSLPAVDDGLPASPGFLTYVVTSLPATALRDAADSHVILPGDLPYTLIGGGDALNFTAPPLTVSLESFQYHVNDGGTPPEGGQSSLGTLWIDIVAPILGDINFDGIVGVTDLLILLADWGVCGGCDSDLNEDGFVNVTDLLLLLANWGNTLPPPPSPGAGTSLAKGSEPLPVIPITFDRQGIDQTQAITPADLFLNDGVLAPIDVGGIIEIDRNYRQTQRGELIIELAGSYPIEQHDLLIVNGHATLDGVLSVYHFDDFEPRIGDRFIFLIADQIDGRFSKLDLPILPHGAEYRIDYRDKAAIIHVELQGMDKPLTIARDVKQVPRIAAQKHVNSRRIVGDLDRDGALTVRDVTRLLDHWNRTHSRADLNRDHIVDAADLLILLDQMID